MVVAPSLAELDVIIVDCQSTGASPAHGSLLEIAWARPAGEASVVESHRIALPEGEKVPRIVAKLTGHVEARPHDALLPAEAWRRLREAATLHGEREAPAVIHFARFELAFLRDLHARFEPGTPFPLDAVCTHAIARRLLPTLPRRSLRALSGYFGQGCADLRRSGEHVAATAFVWRHLAEALEAEGVRDWDELRAWLQAPAPTSRGRTYPLAREKRLSLPDAPGVYRLLRGNGDVLYVGKATSLKQRVSSHYAQGGRARERALELYTQVREVDVTETATALEAALLEADEIKRLDPPYNVQLRAAERAAWFASPGDLADAAPAPDEDHRVGPLPSRRALAPFAAARAIALGAAATGELRARAVGVPRPWGPDEAVFGAGWSAFAARHLAPVRARSIGGAVARAAAALARAAAEGELDDGPSDDPEAPAWDPERVLRHLERSFAQGAALVRRARWLCLLSDCAVAFRDHGRRRLLVIEGTAVVSRADLADDAPLPAPPPRRSFRERQALFDAAAYDRLRALATELLRVEARLSVRARSGEPLSFVASGQARGSPAATARRR